MRSALFILIILLASSCDQQIRTTLSAVHSDSSQIGVPFSWDNAMVYFLLIDRFNNGDPSNDLSLGRKQDGAVLRNFIGGDLAGITAKINEGYFNRLGVTAIWFTPPIEQIHGSTDEGTGLTYGYHGYWARDWTAIDPNYGNKEALKAMIDAAHEKGIRILMDAVANHTGPVTDIDSQWPDTWVRTTPKCTYEDTETTVKCTLVENLPDIKTERNEPVDLPAFLVEKWKKENRYEEEIASLDTFFRQTGYPRAPRFYIIKWLTDWIRNYGIDGFRVDTAKHTEASVWKELLAEALKALRDWKNQNPEKKLDDLPFYMTGEVYNYSIHHGRAFDMGKNEKIDFFANGLYSLINFSLKLDAKNNPEEVFSQYSNILHHGALKGQSILNYMTSHDDGNPFDRERKKPLETGTMLLLCPGACQVYYGDETARPLRINGANGDANLRSFMNWEDLEENRTQNGTPTKAIFEHWSKLGQFRKEHLSVGAGIHQKISDKPYFFKRTYQKDMHTDQVMVGMDLKAGKEIELPVDDVFQNGNIVFDYYSGKSYKVKNQVLSIIPTGNLALLGIQQ